MKIIIFERPDGSVWTRTPVEPMNSNENEKEYLDRLASVNTRSSTHVGDIDHSELPKDHEYFKKARRWDGAQVTIDIAKARDIHAERIAAAQLSATADLQLTERKERLKGNTVQTAKLAAMIVDLEALDLDVLATQIAAAPNPAALNAVWPIQIPK